MKRLRNRNGFTLLELMTVVVVIGTLAALALPRVTQIKKYAYTDAVKNSLGKLAQQQEEMFHRENQYAASVTDPKLGFAKDDKVVVSIDYVNESNWLATAYYLSFPDGICALAMGEEITALTGYVSGKIECASL